MNANDPQFWMMIASIVIAVCFIVMAAAMIAIALVVRRVVGTVKRVEEKVDPILNQIEPLMLKVNAIGEQGKLISGQFNEISENLSTATKYFAESAGLVREEVAELKLLVGQTALVAKDKVELVSNTIERTNHQVATTTEFIQTKVVEPAREIAAIMAGVRKGLEVLFAPAPKQIDRVYMDDEMFIG
jgi:methyl-accepting chemotaxis protein